MPDKYHLERKSGNANGTFFMGRAICQPTLFWLDGHYSAGVTARGAKDTPIFEELNHILTSTDLGHVIIIDDARCFGTEPAYPSIKELCDYIKSHRSNVDIVIKDDSIRIIPLQIAE